MDHVQASQAPGSPGSRHDCSSASRGPGSPVNPVHQMGTFHWRWPLVCRSSADHCGFQIAQSCSTHSSQPNCRSITTKETHSQCSQSGPWKPRSAATLTTRAVVSDIHVDTQTPPHLATCSEGSKQCCLGTRCWVASPSWAYPGWA